ncbi:hypothetical protein DFH09DRAFT_1323137 [Mycena vulgaris]|nr:hypothetical protein DFH09DRAFT_1323137 [Mycena vulgaris]
MAESVFSIQELCDHIAHHIAVDDSPHDTLKSTALVCQTLYIPAQSPTSSSIHSTFPVRIGGIGTVEVEAVGASWWYFEAIVSRTLRLSGILVASPHLLRFINSLHLLADTAVLTLLSGTHFPVLRKFGLNFFTRKFPSADVFHFVRDLIALPSMREVDIVQLTKDQNRGSDVLATLFERCTRAWEAVIFQNNDWLISPSRPFNFIELVEVAVQHDSGNPALWQVLTSACMSITRLRIFGAIAQEIDLSKFPALTFLELPCFTSEAISGLNPDNCLGGLILYVGVLHSNAPRSFTFSKTDTLIANSRLPAL